MFGKGHARLGQSLYFLKDYAGAVEAYQNALQYEPDNQVTMIYLQKAKRKMERAEEKAKRRDSVDTSDLVSVAESTMIFAPESPQRDRSAAILTGHRNANLAETLYSAIDHEYPSRYRGSTTTPGDMETVDDVKPWARPSSLSKPSMDDAPYDESPSMNNKGTIQWAQGKDPQQLAYEVKDDDADDDDGPDPDFDKALTLQERASSQLNKKQYKSAVDLYSAALFLVPDDFNLTPHLFVGRANALNGLLRHEGAYNDCKMALNHNSKLAEVHTTMARSLFYLKDYRGAIESFDTAISCLAYGEFLSALDELYYEKAVDLSKDQPIEKVEEDDAVSAVSSSYHSVRSMGTGKPIPKLNPPRFVSRVEVRVDSLVNTIVFDFFILELVALFVFVGPQYRTRCTCFTQTMG
jgi:tetratricopeptide (TPR) repeat protein